jgi:hypothetical protein
MTQFETVGFLAVLKGLLFKLTVRQLHRYVMEGFRDLAEKRIL